MSRHTVAPILLVSIVAGIASVYYVVTYTTVLRSKPSVTTTTRQDQRDETRAADTDERRTPKKSSVTSSISGYVFRNDSREPVSDAEIVCRQLVDANAPRIWTDIGTQRSGADGGFEFSPLEFGSYEINCQAGALSLVSDLLPMVVVSSASPHPTIELELFAEVKVSGSVTTSDTHKYIQGAIVEISRAGTKGRRAGTTDGSGNYQLTVPAGHKYVVACYRPAGYVVEDRMPYKTAMADFLDSLSNGMRIDFSFLEGIRLAGLLSDTRGRPVADAQVSLLRNGTSTVFHASSDERGHFTFGGCDTNADYILSATARGYANNILQLSQDDLISKELVVTLTPASEAPALTGLVTTRLDAPLPGVELQLTIEQYGQDFYSSDQQTDRHGRFEFRGLPNGTGILRAIDSAGKPLVITNSPSPEGILPLSITAQAQNVDLQVAENTTQLQGRVTDAKQIPISGAIITASAGGRSLSNGTSAQDGLFQLDNVPTCLLSIAVNAEGYGSKIISKVNPAKPLMISLDKPALLTIRIVDDDTGNPVSSSGVGVIEGPSALKGVESTPGVWYFSDVIPGRYYLNVLATDTPERFAEQRLFLDVEKEEQYDLSVRLKRGCLLKGFVFRDCEGSAPVANGFLYLYSADDPSKWTNVKTDESGQFSVLLVPGKYSVATYSKLTQYEIVEIMIPSEEAASIDLPMRCSNAGLTIEVPGRTFPDSSFFILLRSADTSQSTIPADLDINNLSELQRCGVIGVLKVHPGVNEIQNVQPQTYEVTLIEYDYDAKRILTTATTTCSIDVGVDCDAVFE